MKKLSSLSAVTVLASSLAAPSSQASLPPVEEIPFSPLEIPTREEIVRLINPPKNTKIEAYLRMYWEAYRSVLGEGVRCQNPPEKDYLEITTTPEKVIIRSDCDINPFPEKTEAISNQTKDLIQRLQAHTKQSCNRVLMKLDKIMIEPVSCQSLPFSPEGYTFSYEIDPSPNTPRPPSSKKTPPPSPEKLRGSIAPNNFHIIFEKGNTPPQQGGVSCGIDIPDHQCRDE